jgi:TrmH family RNA methyltransferase
VLTSARNPKVAAAVRLHRRAFRDEDRRFLVEGARCVREALAASRLEATFTLDELDPVAVAARQAGVEVHHVGPQVIERLTSTVTPQGLVGVAPFVDRALEDVPVGGCTAVLDAVRDPGNAGTIVRSADAAGASAVVFTDGSVDPYNPKAVRATAGSIFHLPVVRGIAASEAVASLRARGVRVLAMAADGDVDLDHADLSSPVAFVFGNEAHGLSKQTRDSAEASVRIPIGGSAESLNLAAAATVCLFEWARRRRRGAGSLEALVAAAAHDIRSPLTAMKGFGYALEQRWEEMDAEQRMLMLQAIVYDADRMDTILRQLVDAARVVGGTFEAFPEATEVRDLVEQIAASQSRDPEHPEVRWEGPPATAFVDPIRLRTSLLSFVEALAWWAEEGPIVISGEVSGGRLVVETRRRGTELSNEGAENLFMTRRPGSAGGSKIGLFVAREVVVAQGGSASASVDDGWLRFRLELSVG